MPSSDDEASSSYPPPPLTASRTYIARKAKEILATRDLIGVSKLVTNLCFAKETDKSSKLLFDSFVNYFPNCLAVKLLEVYRFAFVIPKIRSFCLSLLDSVLIELDESRGGLRTECLKDIKEHLSSCFSLQETTDHDFKLLSKIVSRVSVDIFINYISWDELCYYIVSLKHDHKKTLLIFSDLPTLLEEGFLIPLFENGLHVKIVKGLLLNQECDDDEEEEEKWCLALEAGFNMALQHVNLQRKDLVWDMVYSIVNSVIEMVNVKRREIVVRKGLIRLARIVRREALRFREHEYEVVSRLVLMIKRISGVGEETKMAAQTILDILDRYYMGGKGLLDCGLMQGQIRSNNA